MMDEEKYLRFKVSHGESLKDVFPCISPLCLQDLSEQVVGCSEKDRDMGKENFSTIEGILQILHGGP